MTRSVTEWEEAGKSPSFRFVRIYRESFMIPSPWVSNMI